MSFFRLSAAILICGAIGCATVPPAASTTTPVASDEPRRETDPSPTPVAESAPTAPPRPPHVIYRRELLAVLDTSPGVFLSHVESEPLLQHGRFIGWRIVKFFSGDSRMNDAPLVAGDVVLRVNGAALERPENLADVWRRLRDAAELRVEVARPGSPNVVVLQWTIVDG